MKKRKTGNGYMAGAELNEDMLSIKENTITVMTPKGGTLQDYAFREATYVFYRNGLYYFLWSVDDTGSANYHVAYGTSKSPLGPIAVAKDPVTLIQRLEKEIYGTAHNSVLQIPGTDEWYTRQPHQNRDSCFVVLNEMIGGLYKAVLSKIIGKTICFPSFDCVDRWFQGGELRWYCYT